MTDRPHIARTCVCCSSAALRRSPAILMPFVAKRALGWDRVTIDETWNLRDVPNGAGFAICNSVLCEKCGLIFLDMRFDDADMASLYRAYRGEEYVALRDFYEPGYRARNEALTAESPFLPQIEKFLQKHVMENPRILDWGGDSGANTPLRRQAKVLDIFDISGNGVVSGARAVDEATATACEYDLVILRHVLEHIPFPEDIIRAVSRAMGPATTLYIEVPHEQLMVHARDGADALSQKKHWHEHVNFYTIEALGALLARSGLTIRASESIDVSSADAPYRVLGVVAERQP